MDYGHDRIYYQEYDEDKDYGYMGSKTKFYLQYKTKGDLNSKEYPGVYFCCHEDDFINTFESVTDEVLSIQKNLAFWYYDPKDIEMNDEDLVFYLSKMLLFVIPITLNFIYKKSHARDVEMAYALEHHVPILPLMMESGLEQDFTNVCGNIQFLDKTNTDPTAIPCKEKIEKFLKEVLIDKYTICKIRESFDAYVFLSYRKKDRKYVEKVMSLIHADEVCRDIAIWYDEFLIPGENPDISIEVALKKSSLFVLAVTNSILETPNYVRDVEYPMAKRNNKPILPIQLEKVDQDEVSQCYNGIPEIIPADNVEKITQKILVGLKKNKIVLRKNDCLPKHLFFMSLAYLYGIDVERKPEISVELLKRAADNGLDKAYEKLVNMYSIGDGVKRDYYEAIVWQKKYIKILENRKSYLDKKSAILLEKNRRRIEKLKELSVDGNIRPEEEYDLSDVIPELLKEPYTSWDIEIKLSDELANLGELLVYIGNAKLAKECYERAYKLRKRLINGSSSSQILYKTSSSLNLIGLMYLWDMNKKEAWKIFEKTLEISEKLAQKFGCWEYWTSVVYNLNQFDGICETREEVEKAKEYSKRALWISEHILDSKTILAMRCRGDSLLSLSNICRIEKKWEEAENYGERALEIHKEIYKALNEIEDLKRISSGMSNLGKIFKENYDNIRAIEYYKQCVELDLKIFKETGTVASENNLSSSYSNLGSMYERKGKTREARNYFEKALEIDKRLANETDAAFFWSNLATTNNNIGNVLNYEERYDEARRYYSEAIRIDQNLKQILPKMEGLAIVFHNLAYLNELDERNQDAKEYYEKSLEIRAELAEKTGIETHISLLLEEIEKVEDIIKAEGNLERKKIFYKRYLKLGEELADKYKSTVIQIKMLKKLGKLFDSLDEYDDALKYYEQIILIRQNETESEACIDQEEMLLILRKLGRICESLNKWENAKEYYKMALEYAEKYENYTVVCFSLNSLGILYEEEENWEKAKNCYNRALLVGHKCVDENGTAIAMMALSETMFNLGFFYSNQHMYSKSKTYFRKDLKILEKLMEMRGGVKIQTCVRDTLKKLGDVNMQEGNWEEATEYYKKASELEIKY